MICQFLRGLSVGRSVGCAGVVWRKSPSCPSVIYLSNGMVGGDITSITAPGPSRGEGGQEEASQGGEEPV